MKSFRFVTTRWSLLFLLLLSLLFASLTLAQDTAVPLLDNVSTDSVDATLAKLSDEQVRQLLINELKKDAALQEDSFTLTQELNGPSAPLAAMLNSVEGESVQSIDKLQQLFRNIPQLIPDLSHVFLSLCVIGTSEGSIINLTWMLIFLSIGLGAEQLVKKIVLKKYFQSSLANLEVLKQGQRFLASVIIKIPDVIGVFIFFAVSYLTFIFFDRSESSFVQLTFFAFVITIVLIKILSIISSIMLSPQIAGFRVLPLECPAAKTIHRLILWSFAYIVSVLMFVVVLHKLGTPHQSVVLLQLFFATALLVVTALLVFFVKNRVQNYIVGSKEVGNDMTWGIDQFASIWHFLAILYLIVLWILLIQSISVSESGTKNAFLLSFFVVPIWMVADKITQWLVRYAMSTLKIHEEQYDTNAKVDEEILEIRKNGKELYLKTRFIARLGLIAILGIWIAGLWNITFPFVSNLASVALDSLIIITLAMFFWRMVSSWIEAKIGDETQDEQDGNNDEWGAVARGRSYTILPMIRKFVASVLVIMVTMTILSSFGVDIGPLLAGAGVVGLAVGFGAQKLVADMFSGFFSLLDDAFRVGEYLEAGTVSGTVESITLRNVMLRHHRGMLMIVPHSELGPITNFMRGGIVVKFNLDFNYNANIDKIRKIIKKVGIAMLEDEEFGTNFIQPVKSQGVREITNSVMTIRVKFTAKPGTHFVIRREAYRRITESLKKNGIEYAMKQVVVDVPGLAERKSEFNPTEVKQIVNAAGGAARLLQEQQPLSTNVAKDSA